jgi:hypothetical protein
MKLKRMPLIRDSDAAIGSPSRSFLKPTSSFFQEVKAGKNCKCERLKSDIEKTIEGRVAAAFADILPETGTRHEILKGAHDSVRAV